MPSYVPTAQQFASLVAQVSVARAAVDVTIVDQHRSAAQRKAHRHAQRERNRLESALEQAEFLTAKYGFRTE